MKYVDEYRDPERVKALLAEIGQRATRDYTLMEICGGQTHAIVKYGLDTLLPPSLSLVHGPGCPVCVTPLELIEQALALAAQPEVIFCTFGDMMRVPGCQKDLQVVKAEGGDVRVVYSPLDALALAQQNPARQVVFFSVGFETTAPATAMAVYQAHLQGIPNFLLLVSHVLVPPAMHAILSAPSQRISGFLAAGHVCTVMGAEAYAPIAAQYGVPIVVTGFEPVDILQGILCCVQQLERGEARVENAYARAVRQEGNRPARDMLREVFQVTHRKWRGLGEIKSSGFQLQPKYQAHDASRHFGLEDISVPEPAACRSGEVLQGLLTPSACAAFGTSCTPETPLGAPMVSSEGACAAYYLYRHMS